MAKYSKYFRDNIKALKTFDVNEYRKFVEKHKNQYDPHFVKMFMNIDDCTVLKVMSSCIIQYQSIDSNLFTKEEIDKAMRVRFS